MLQAGPKDFVSKESLLLDFPLRPPPPSPFLQVRGERLDKGGLPREQGRREGGTGWGHLLRAWKGR